MKIILFGKKNEEFDSFKDLFQNISEKGLFISQVKDGEIITTDDQILKFAIITEDNTAALFTSDVEVYREELRASITLFKKQGINVPKEEIDKITKQLEFLKHKKADEVPQA